MATDIVFLRIFKIKFVFVYLLRSVRSFRHSLLRVHAAGSFQKGSPFFSSLACVIMAHACERPHAQTTEINVCGFPNEAHYFGHTSFVLRMLSSKTFKIRTCSIKVYTSVDPAVHFSGRKQAGHHGHK